MHKEADYLFLLANAGEDWHFEEDTSSYCHPARFSSLLKLVRFRQIWGSYFDCLRAHTAKIRSASDENEREVIRKALAKRLKSVKLRLEARETLRKENNRQSTKFYRQLLNPKMTSIPKWTLVDEDCDLPSSLESHFERSRSL